VLGKEGVLGKLAVVAGNVTTGMAVPGAVVGKTTNELGGNVVAVVVTANVPLLNKSASPLISVKVVVDDDE
jgi:hypothetical protein